MGEDFIELFQTYTEGSFSPENFKLWGGIFVVAAALERRVWVQTRRRTLPNLYIWLVAPPGIGKQVIDDGKNLLRAYNRSKAVHKLFISNDSVSSASLLDDLVKAKQVFLPTNGPALEYHSMAAFAEEVGVLIPAYDQTFLTRLNALYNNPDEYSESRRHGPVRELVLKNPQLNLLAGAQPGWMQETLPETAWSGGFTSRLIMVYASESPFRELFMEENNTTGVKSRLLSQLEQLTRLNGACQLSAEAAARLAEWHRLGGPPAPTHSKLEYYKNRRTTLHVVKLAMIAAVSRTKALVIDLEDVDRAIGWLIQAEAVMPDIFRAMVGRSDAQVIEELHFYLTALWRAAKLKPIPEEKLFHFLHQRVPSEKVEKIIMIAERSNVIARIAGTAQYVPKPRAEFDIE